MSLCTTAGHESFHKEKQGEKQYDALIECWKSFFEVCLHNGTIFVLHAMQRLICTVVKEKLFAHLRPLRSIIQFRAVQVFDLIFLAIGTCVQSVLKLYKHVFI